MMRRLLPLTVLIASISLPCCSSEESDFPAVEGWTQDGEMLLYDADNLWEYINGAAELFIEYDVQTCRTADLTAGDVTVTVDLYDMGTALNAFGVYNRESSGEGVQLPNAIEAVVSPPYQALLLKGATYVKVNAIEGELTDASGRELLAAIASVLPGETAYPTELGLLPQSGKIAGTEGYQRQGFLGLSELRDCLYAEYAGEGDATWQGFVVRSSPESSSIWNTLSGQWESLEHSGRTVLFSEIPYRGLVGVVRAEQGIWGVSGAADQGELLNRLDRFVP
ncbi:MAG: hypothetical protein JSW71_16510 [Gemmatimonadota bacterium]|nr:MAG: hypothetical protein JSW71_16510 [Gemmatimonadota bacterium]